MKVDTFVSSIRSVNLENVFNPYRDVCKVNDSIDSPDRRANSLLRLLKKAVSREVDSIWVGRDLGYLGGRRTGLALTDDVNLKAHGRRWGIDFPKSVKDKKEISERTATAIWYELNLIQSNVMLWNAFPFHPHEPNLQFSNRCHNAKEREIGESILSELVNLIQPNRLIAIGNDAEKSIERTVTDQIVEKVRHPSYGGQKDFSRKIRMLHM